MRQIPRGPDNLVCPFHQKSMEDVCHKCPFWVLIRGKNPNTGEEVDQWNCAIGHLPMLLIENAMQTRQAAAATESFRNEVVQRRDQLAAQPRQMIEG